MSIVKGNLSGEPKIKILDSISVSGQTYKIKEYILLSLQNGYIKIFDNNSIIDSTKLKFKDIIVILGNFDNFNGYILSQHSRNCNTHMTIFKSGNTITWYLGSSTALYSTTVSSGSHILGFANGKAFIDGNVSSVTTSINLNNLVSDLYKLSDSWWGIGYVVTGSCKILRVIILLSETNKVYSFYPCLNVDNNNVCFYEAITTGKFLQNIPSGSTLGSDITYGISLDDLKSAIGSKYKDLLAIITEDSGRSVQIGNIPVHDPYRLIKDGVTHNFAFCLLNVPIPSGASSNSSTAGYRKGELLYGRRPKWNIWANAIPYSVWNRPDTDYGSTYDSERKVYATYNILEHWGKNGYADLTWFNNYCESEDNPPEIKFVYDNGDPATNITLHYHNGIVCNTANEQLMPGLCVDGSAGSYGYVSNMFSCMLAQNASIYVYDNTFIDSSIWMKLGNLINWNASQLTLYDSDKLSNGIPTMNQMIYGEVATLTHSFKTLLSVGNGYQVTWVDVLIGYATQLTRDILTSTNQYLRNIPFISLSSESSPLTKRKFRDGLAGTSGNTKILCEKLRATGNEPVRLYNELLSSVDDLRNHIYEIDAIGSMALLKKSTEITETETPKEKDLVYLDKFIQPTSIKVKGKFDENQLHDYRQFAVDTAAEICPSNHTISSEFSITLYSGVDEKFRLIFMNTFRTTKPTDGSSFVHCDKLYTGNTPYYFFPIGFLSNANYNYCYRHYSIVSESSSSWKNRGGIFIPFVLTTKDYSTYLKAIDNYDNNNNTYGNNPTLRLIAEVTQNIEENGEFQLKKDRVAKIVLKKSQISSNNSLLNTSLIYNKSNYLNLTLIDYTILIAQISPMDLPIICGNSNTIPTNTTIKFWIQNNDIASTILTYNNQFKYSYINNSWYKCIFGSSLYAFVKDLLNNEWMNNEIDTANQGTSNNSNAFDLTISHWFYGKKANIFRYASSTPSRPSGGNYNNPTSGIYGWNDGLTLNSTLKLYMSERFYAKCWEPADTSTDLYAYVHYIETNVFTDLQWSDPVEITNDLDDKYIKVALICNSSSQRDTVFENPLLYIKYIENDGFYGVNKNGITTYIFKALKKSNPTASSLYNYYPCYYNQNNELSVQSGNFNKQGQIYSNSSYSNWDKFNYVIELYFTTDLTLVNKEKKTYNTIDDFRSSDLNDYTTLEHPSSEITYQQYRIKQKYMFSKTSCLTPLDEPGKWDSLSTATSSSSASDYKFMYSEYYIFDIYGTFYKVFNLILIAGDLTTDQYYPVLLKDRNKLITAPHYYSTRDLWYQIGGVNIGEWNIPYTPDEILAPYKVNNLNVSIRDITQVKITYRDPDFRVYSSSAYFNLDTLKYVDGQSEYDTIDRISVFDISSNDYNTNVITYYKNNVI